MKADAVPVLAIDGPGGAGKGTVARALQQRTGWHLLDSGAIYRALALAAQRRGIVDSDQDGLCQLALELDLRFPAVAMGEEPRVLLDGSEAGDALRREETGVHASRLAAMPGVRAALLQRQRDFRRAPGLIADGRDMGSTVFPDACLKVFLTASAAERARRRHKQLKAKGLDVTLASLLEDIRQRDARDRERSVAPLKVSDNALVIDSTGRGIDAVVGTIEQALAKALSDPQRCGCTGGSP